MNENGRPTFDIEAYLAGELPAETRALFEAEMAQNPAFREAVEQQRDLAGHLRAQRIREQVTRILREQPPEPVPQEPSFWKKYWTWLAAAIFLLLLAGLLWWRGLAQSHDAPLNTTLPPKQQAPPSVPKEVAPIPADQPLSPPIAKPLRIPGPIAQNDNPKPGHPVGPLVRGDDDTFPAELQKQIDAVWYTAFDTVTAHYPARFQPAVTALGRQALADAFVELHIQEQAAPADDTLAYLKGYCLLELDEGAEAARYLARLDAPGKPWRAEALWYSGLGYLISGETEKARAQWEKVLALPETGWRKRARRGLQELKK